MSLIELLIYQTVFILSVGLMIYWWQQIKDISDHIIDTTHTLIQEKHIYDLLRYDITHANQQKSWSVEDGLSWQTSTGLCKWFIKKDKLYRMCTYKNIKRNTTTLASNIAIFTSSLGIQNEKVCYISVIFSTKNGPLRKWLIALHE